MAQTIRTRPQSGTPKPRYRVTNWPEYNRAPVDRGSVTLWLCDDVIRGWRARGGKPVAAAVLNLYFGICVG